MKNGLYRFEHVKEKLQRMFSMSCHLHFIIHYYNCTIASVHVSGFIFSLTNFTQHTIKLLFSHFSARPWLFDDLDDWLDRCEGPQYYKAVIFVDNSGGDIILGVFPFARDLLRNGTKVIL